MDRTTLDRLLTDALLLDAVEGLDSVADRLVPLYDSFRLRRGGQATADVLGGILTDVAWWSGRLAGAVSAETAAAMDRLASDER
ncbi:MAG: hypothetical protein ACRD1K_17945 [Acidimicrobiales bacterium]